MFEEPKDMFDGIDNQSTAPKPISPTTNASDQSNVTMPIEPPPSRLPSGYGYGAETIANVPISESKNQTVKWLIVLAVFLVVVGVSGFFAYRIMIQPANNSGIVDAVSDDGVSDDMVDEVINQRETERVQEVNVPSATTSNPASLLDSDGDGLANAKELELGTSVTKADTDGDGLGDREEVEVYATDPRKADTDGDGYLDGQEVSGGYNPNGEGKLFGTVPSGS